MKYKDFEDFLQKIHAHQYKGLADNMLDDFDKWICEADVDTLIKYGDAFFIINECIQERGNDDVEEVREL